MMQFSDQQSVISDQGAFDVNPIRRLPLFFYKSSDPFAFISSRDNLSPH